MCPPELAAILLVVGTLAGLQGANWRAICLAILLPALLLAGGDTTATRLRCTARVRTVRPDAWGETDRIRFPIPRAG